MVAQVSLFREDLKRVQNQADMAMGISHGGIHVRREEYDLLETMVQSQCLPLETTFAEAQKCPKSEGHEGSVAPFLSPKIYAQFVEF